jgi:hypothetical protein
MKSLIACVIIAMALSVSAGELDVVEDPFALLFNMQQLQQLRRRQECQNYCFAWRDYYLSQGNYVAAQAWQRSAFEECPLIQ